MTALLITVSWCRRCSWPWEVAPEVVRQSLQPCCALCLQLQQFGKRHPSIVLPWSVVERPHTGGKNLLLGYTRVSKGGEQTNTPQTKTVSRRQSAHLRGAASGGVGIGQSRTASLDHLRAGDTGRVVWILRFPRCTTRAIGIWRLGRRYQNDEDVEARWIDPI